MALGSIGPSLALDSGLFNGQNVVTLLTPTTAAATGAVNLNDPNMLAGLSESFHPELVNGALLDVLGQPPATCKFVGKQATGLIVNALGGDQRVQIHSATDTAIVGRPLNHVNIPIRHNVQLISSARGPRGTGTKGGVTVSSTLRPFSALTLPRWTKTDDRWPMAEGNRIFLRPPAIPQFERLAIAR